MRNYVQLIPTIMAGILPIFIQIWILSPSTCDSLTRSHKVDRIPSSRTRTHTLRKRIKLDWNLSSQAFFCIPALTASKKDAFQDYCQLNTNGDLDEPIKIKGKGAGQSESGFGTYLAHNQELSDRRPSVHSRNKAYTQTHS